MTPKPFRPSGTYFDPDSVSITLRLTLDESRFILRALEKRRKREELKKKAVEVLETDRMTDRLTPEEVQVARSNIIRGIKLVRERLGISLKEARDLVEDAIQGATS